MTPRPWDRRLCGVVLMHRMPGERDTLLGSLWHGDVAARGAYADQAKAILEAKKFRADTKAKAAYEKGILPDGHVHARAKRYAVKLFLAHWHEVAYREHFGTEPPLPYALAILGHAHAIHPSRRAAA